MENFKIVTIGSAGTGKTQIMMQYCENQFDENPMTTIGVEYKKKQIRLENKDITLQIWDTAGQERFKAISRSIYHGARGMFIVYDITKSRSFQDVPNWLDEVRTLLPRDTPIFLLGNKCDLEDLREVKFEQGDKFAKDNGLIFLETSAKDRTNVDKAFELMAQKIFDSAKEVSAAQAAADSTRTGANRVSANRVGAPAEENSNKVNLSKTNEASSATKTGGGGKCSKC